jgi:hypothetical protein
MHRLHCAEFGVFIGVAQYVPAQALAQTAEPHKQLRRYVP